MQHFNLLEYIITRRLCIYVKSNYFGKVHNAILLLIRIHYRTRITHIVKGVTLSNLEYLVIPRSAHIVSPEQVLPGHHIISYYHSKRQTKFIWVNQAMVVKDKSR